MAERQPNPNRRLVVERGGDDKSSVLQSWVQKAKLSGDNDAAEKVHRDQHRPAEELYDVTGDWYEWKNLADDPKYAKVKAELKQ